MGYMADKREARAAKGKKKRTFAFSKPSGTLTFGTWPNLLSLLRIITEDGDGVSLTKTSDGGACVLTILNGTPPYAKVYAANEEEARIANEQILHEYELEETDREAFE